MKYIAALLIAAVPFATFAAEATPAAAPVKKQPFYRQRATTPGKKATGGPVVANAASYVPGVSPGGLATIFGRDLSTVSEGHPFLADTNPFPTVLGGVSVVVNGVLAPIFSVAYSQGQDQISFQVPYATATGPNAVDIQVLNQTNSGANVVVAELHADSFTEDPGIFMYSGTYALAQAGSDYSLIGPDNPAIPGEIIILYTTGLGPLTLNLPDGLGAPSNPLAETQDPFQVIVNNQPAQVLFSGLTPGYVGVYQINLQLPNNLPPGNLQIQLLSQYANSGIAILPVR